MEVKTVCVYGAGLMGHGIAQVCAASGYTVYLRDRAPEYLDKAMGSIKKTIDKLVSKGKLSESDGASMLERIKPTMDDAEALQNADFVIEAVFEDLEIKKETFAFFDKLCPDHAVLASNTAQFSVTAISAATKRPDKVVGMHWFLPPAVMRLIEIVRADDTSDETIAIVEAVSKQCGKETVVSKDRQGFITTRALIALATEAFRMLEEGVASKEDIDKAIRLGLNHPMGPLELSDYSGLELHVKAADSMRQMYGDRFLTTQTVRNLVQAGHYGRKTGRGIYDYNKK